MKNLPSGYVKSLVRMFLTAFVILGALNYGSTAIDYNLIEIGNSKIDQYFNIKTYFNVILYSIIGVSGFLLMFQTTTWLPFLGPCAFPSKGLIPDKLNQLGTKTIKVKTNE